LTLSEAKELDSFLDDVQNKENGKEVAFILNKLFLDHAFLFCATANEVLFYFPFPYKLYYKANNYGFNSKSVYSFYLHSSTAQPTINKILGMSRMNMNQLELISVNY